jgi:hypothetical protein
MALAQIGKWRGRNVEVTARVIARCLWTTASIDVYIDSECVLRTGGQMKSIGVSTAQFYDSGSTHDIALEWGRAAVRSFPITITIDGQVVADSVVSVDNWPLALWPLILFGAVGAAATWFACQLQ